MFDHPAITAISRSLHARSASLLTSLEGRLAKIALYWLGIAALASTVRIAIGPMPVARLDGGSFLPYVLLVVAPVASLFLALHWFRDAESMPQPDTRLAR